jgi:hypothetical protein
MHHAAAHASMHRFGHTAPTQRPHSTHAAPTQLWLPQPPHSPHLHPVPHLHLAAGQLAIIVRASIVVKGIERLASTYSVTWPPRPRPNTLPMPLPASPCWRCSTGPGRQGDWSAYGAAVHHQLLLSLAARLAAGHVLGTCWAPAGHLLGTCWAPAGHLHTWQWTLCLLQPRGSCRHACGQHNHAGIRHHWACPSPRSGCSPAPSWARTPRCAPPPSSSAPACTTPA